MERAGIEAARCLHMRTARRRPGRAEGSAHTISRTLDQTLIGSLRDRGHTAHVLLQRNGLIEAAAGRWPFVLSPKAETERQNILLSAESTFGNVADDTPDPDT